MNIGVSDVIKLCELATKVYKNCRDCNGEYKSLTSEARSLTNLLEDIGDKFDKIPDSKYRQLQDVYEPCVQVLQDLDQLLVHYNSLDSRSKRTWDRLKWDPDKSRTLRQRLTSSVAMLNAFYSSMIHDSQVLILEALGRLELDYRGGHREESVASLERITNGEDDEDEDAAWSQILRDLEDIGVAKQDALGYRDMIIDWLVAAVNEGRLIEQRPEPQSLVSTPGDLAPALPDISHEAAQGSDLAASYFSVPLPESSQGTSQESNAASSYALPEASQEVGRDGNPTLSYHLGTHPFDVPDLATSHHRNLIPFRQPAPPSPFLRLPIDEMYRTKSVPATSITGAQDAPRRLSAPEPNALENDNASLYDPPDPAPAPLRTRNRSFDGKQIKRVPVPQPAPAPRLSAAPSIHTSTSSSTLAEEVRPTASFPPPLTLASMAPPVPLLPVDIYAETFPAPQVYCATIDEAEAPVSMISTQPPEYHDKKDPITADLAWTAQQIIAAWQRHDFSAAEKSLQEMLAAVERGHVVLGTGLQPDRRILRHLIGVCASYCGNFEKAKKYFESVFNGIYLNRMSLDDGDIAAARWLGDVCMHLRQHQNAMLAWCVAFEGCIGRYGISRDRTQRVASELRLLDRWLSVFMRIETSFQNNIDPTDIFKQTQAIEKANLIAVVKVQLIEVDNVNHAHGSVSHPYIKPAYTVGPRGRLDQIVSEGFLLSPLVSLGAWPFPWDPTFSPTDSAQLDRAMNTIRVAKVIVPLIERTLPTASLGASRTMHYITKRGSPWLVSAVKQALQSLCIEHAEHAYEPSITCCLNQLRDGFALSEGVEVSFRKLQFRNVYGIKVSDVKYLTRSNGTTLDNDSRETTNFRDILTAMLEDIERATTNASFPSLAELPGSRSGPMFDAYR